MEQQETTKRDGIAWVARFLILAVLLTAGVLELAETLGVGTSIDRTQGVWNSPEAVRPWGDAQAAARKFIQQHRGDIELCEDRDAVALESTVAALESFFDLKGAAIEAFIDDIFSFSSRIELACLWLSGEDGVHEHLKRKLEQHFGSPENLRGEFQRLNAALGHDLTRNQNLLELALGEDLGPATGIAGLTMPGGENLHRDLQANFSDALGGVVPQTVGLQIGVEVVSLLLAEAAVVAAGISSTWATVGVGLAVAVAVDTVASHVAEGHMRSQLERSLEAWRHRSVSDYREAAERELRRFHRGRVASLEESIRVQIETHVSG
jgi:hypothetical protein